MGSKSWAALDRPSSILDRASSRANSALTEVQALTDGLVSVSIQEGTNLKTAAAMLGAGWVGRATRIGVLTSLPGQAFVRGASYVPALAAESAAFAGIERGFHPSSQPFQKDWARAAVTLMGLKAFGGISRGQNIVLQHLFTDLGLVSGHHAAHAVGLMDKPQGNFSQQMFQAEATNWQMKGSMAFAHSFSPRLLATEKSLDLYLETRKGSFLLPSSPFLSQIVWAMEGGARGSFKDSLKNQEHLFKISSSDPEGSPSQSLRDRLVGNWKVEELFEASVLASLSKKGFLRQAGFRMRIDPERRHIKINESAWEPLIFRLDPSKERVLEIVQYDQKTNPGFIPHEDAGRLAAILKTLQEGGVLSARALDLLGVSPAEVAAAQPLQEKRETLKLRIKSLNRGEPSELPSSLLYNGPSTLFVDQGSARFLNPEGPIDGLYAEALRACIGLIAISRDPMSGALRNIGLGHLDIAPEKDLRQFFHHLRKGEAAKVEVYVLGDPIRMNHDMTLKIFRVLEEENADIRFVSVNRHRRGREDDAVLVDRHGVVYYGDRNDFSVLYNPNFSTFVERLRGSKENVLVFPDLETANLEELRERGVIEGKRNQSQRTERLDRLDRNDRDDWNAWNDWRKTSPTHGAKERPPSPSGIHKRGRVDNVEGSSPAMDPLPSVITRALADLGAVIDRGAFYDGARVIQNLSGLHPEEIALPLFTAIEKRVEHLDNKEELLNPLRNSLSGRTTSHAEGPALLLSHLSNILLEASDPAAKRSFSPEVIDPAFLLPRRRIEYRPPDDLIIPVWKDQGPKKPETILDFLANTTFDFNRLSYEFSIHGALKPGHLQRLLRLPYEIRMSEQEGQVILNTGQKKSAGTDPLFSYVRTNSLLNLHTHVIKPGEAPHTVPSLQDALSTDEVTNPATSLLLVHPEGITLFKKPHWDFIDGQAWTGHAWALVEKFLTGRGYNPPWGRDSKLKSYLDEQSQIGFELSKEFAERSGMIVRAVEWDDSQGIAQIMGIINLEKSE